MYSRKKRKKSGAEIYGYWSLCETVPTAKGPRQRLVASLCKLDEEEVRTGGWDDIGRLLSGKPAARPGQKQLGESLQSPPARWEKVHLGAVSVERVREFGEVYLPLAFWHRLGLGKLLAELIEPGRGNVGWKTVANVLVAARFCSQRSELGIAEGVDEKTPQEDLLGQRLAEALARIHAGLVRKPQEDLEKVGPRIGRLQGEHPAAAKIIEARVKKDSTGRVCGLDLWSCLESGQQAHRRQGAHLLRANCEETDLATLWRWYIQLISAEAAFRTAQSDLGLRPIFHHLESRADAQHPGVLFVPVALVGAVAAVEGAGVLCPETHRVGVRHQEHGRDPAS
jgi:hypothetical protein